MNMKITFNKECYVKKEKRLRRNDKATDQMSNASFA